MALARGSRILATATSHRDSVGLPCLPSLVARINFAIFQITKIFAMKPPPCKGMLTQIYSLSCQFWPHVGRGALISRFLIVVGCKVRSLCSDVAVRS